MATEGSIIDEIYDLVATPDAYDAFMVNLEEKLTTMRQNGEAGYASALSQHMQRASALVDIVTPWRRETDETLHQELAKRVQVTAALDENGNVLDANMAAMTAYDLVPDSSIATLPISTSDAARLKDRVMDMSKHGGRQNSPNDVLRFRNEQSGRPILVRLERYVQPSTQRPLVILRTGDVGWPAHLGPILQDLFDLSRAEIDVIRLMVEGLKVKEMARRRRAAVSTVRSQLQSIFSKTETVDQMDCTRMVYGLALMHEVDEGNLVAARLEARNETAFFPREDQRHVLTLPDGRLLDYSDFGATDGRDVVLWYHDQAFGDVWFKEPVQMAARRNIRIIGPLRPGFGRTTVYPGEASEPRDFVPDVQALLDHLGIDRVAIVSSSSGLVHALAAAAQLPDRITGITACHPLLPVLSDEDLEGTNGYNYLLPHARLHFPASVKFLCKAGFAFVMRSGPAAFGKAVMRASPKDVEWITRPDILPVMVHGRRVHRDQGHVGNFGDLNYREDWRPLLTDCPVAVRLVIGEHDRNVQWGAARRWSEALDHVTLEVLPNSGYMVFHQQYAQILDWAHADLKGQSDA
ncbi:alpha/beta hydrolase [uncultured Tateyamaria sp.]|uniref:alpha/beta hydrolase n=1 Tax=uncultured Tateyamaria sp. TaxID=455651 RepID=UPI002639E5D1|nr:alpha/beta hydrolase [uncultured Tateyamaria sp.]